MHLTKIMTLIAIKIEEKFNSLAKAFLYFDRNNSQKISKQEFSKGLEVLRLKLSKEDIDHVFDHVDLDQDGLLSYQEFCGFAEEKRRNIDPFEPNSEVSPRSMLPLTSKTIDSLPNPYSNIKGS
mmetsp:Transcript_40279/g.61468  ORF Transcript_40279/g.61468 Transcript_40279/m.61468 type:complete len:124 (-) Transcript_40279:765-1136(-)